MNELHEIAKSLLESNTVNLVIGFEEGSGNKTRAAFVSKPEGVSKLVFNSRCIQNLAVYLTKEEIKHRGNLAIVAPLPVMRAIIQLASEFQIREENVVVLGMAPEGQVKRFNNFREVDEYVNLTTIQIDAHYKGKIAHINSLSVAERWNFWIEELAPCFKCYACRAACPMCYCHRCTVDMNQPQWIPVPSHKLGNLDWHIMRAMHLAGRCVDCDSCAEACPLGIPLNLLNKQLIAQFQQDYGSYSPKLHAEHLLSTFKPDDKDNFIH